MKTQSIISMERHDLDLTCCEQAHRIEELEQDLGEARRQFKKYRKIANWLLNKVRRSDAFNQELLQELNEQCCGGDFQDLKNFLDTVDTEKG